MDKDQKQKWLNAGGEELQYTFESIGPESIVFDIGLYKGKWSKEIAKRYNPYIYGFEPIFDFYQEAQKTLAEYPKVKLFNYGLGPETCNYDIYVNGDATTLIADEHKTIKQVRIRSIKDVMEDRSLNFIALASINIEGTEYELLEYMFNAGLMPKFGGLLVQFHDIPGSYRYNHYRRETIRTLMSMTHKKVYLFDTVWELWIKRK